MKIGEYQVHVRFITPVINHPSAKKAAYTTGTLISIHTDEILVLLTVHCCNMTPALCTLLDFLLSLCPQATSLWLSRWTTRSPMNTTSPSRLQMAAHHRSATWPLWTSTWLMSMTTDLPSARTSTQPSSARTPSWERLWWWWEYTSQL